MFISFLFGGLENSEWINWPKKVDAYSCTFFHVVVCLRYKTYIPLPCMFSLNQLLGTDWDYSKVLIQLSIFRMKYILFFSTVIRASVIVSLQQSLHIILRNKTRTETVFTLIWASWITCFMSCWIKDSSRKCELRPVFS